MVHCVSPGAFEWYPHDTGIVIAKKRPRHRCQRSLFGLFFVNPWPVQIPAMNPDKKRGSPIGGLIAGLLLLGAVGLGLATGRMPLARATNLGVEIDRRPIVFWAYAAVLDALGVAALAWSLWTLTRGNLDSQPPPAGCAGEPGRCSPRAMIPQLNVAHTWVCDNHK
jgi:hypothetical protein